MVCLWTLYLQWESKRQCHLTLKGRYQCLEIGLFSWEPWQRKALLAQHSSHPWDAEDGPQNLDRYISFRYQSKLWRALINITATLDSNQQNKSTQCNSCKTSIIWPLLDNSLVILHSTLTAASELSARTGQQRADCNNANGRNVWATCS